MIVRALPAAAVALAAGIAHAVAFAPASLPWLQVLALAAVFFFAVRAQSALRAALLGFAFGLGWFCTGVHWVWISMHHYGGLDAVLAALATLALSAYLALFPAAALGLAARISRPGAARALLVLPALWALFEWLRGWLLTGFPWVSSGTAHADGPLAGYAPLIGAYGIGWLAALLAGGLAVLTLGRAVSWRAGAAAILLGAAILGGGFALRGTAWTEPVGEPLRVRLVQGNTPQSLKFSAPGMLRAAETHRRLLAGAPVDLAVLPESFLPLPWNHVPGPVAEPFMRWPVEQRATLLFGIFIEAPGPRYLNSALALAPEGGIPQRYSKQQLVPFGEFVPPGFRWFVDAMKIPLADQTPGDPRQEPIRVRDQRIAVNICYEDVFPEVIRRAFRPDAPDGAQPTLLLNLSNLAWFNDSVALPQHLQIARMRAMETGRPMLRATNTGATALIDARGAVLEALPYRTEGALTVSVRGHTGLTPYVRIGDAPLLVLLLALTSLGAFASRRGEPRAPRGPRPAR